MKFKFKRYDTHTIMDGLVVRYKFYFGDKPKEDFGVFGELRLIKDNGQISASRNGVMISGPVPRLDSREDFAVFRDALSRAEQQFQRLKSNRRILGFSQILPLSESDFAED